MTEDCKLSPYFRLPGMEQLRREMRTEDAQAVLDNDRKRAAERNRKSSQRAALTRLQEKSA
jgi:hypothetical protein